MTFYSAATMNDVRINSLNYADRNGTDDIRQRVMRRRRKIRGLLGIAFLIAGLLFSQIKVIVFETNGANCIIAMDGKVTGVAAGEKKILLSPFGFDLDKVILCNATADFDFIDAGLMREGGVDLVDVERPGDESYYCSRQKSSKHWWGISLTVNWAKNNGEDTP